MNDPGLRVSDAVDLRGLGGCLVLVLFGTSVSDEECQSRCGGTWGVPFLVRDKQLSFRLPSCTREVCPPGGVRQSGPGPPV